MNCGTCHHPIIGHTKADCACCRNIPLALFGYWRCPLCRHARDFDNHAPWVDQERTSLDDDVLCLNCDYAGPMPFHHLKLYVLA